MRRRSFYHGQIPAFPGADGAAAQATGGRGGVVYDVTRLDRNYGDTGKGTLRNGLKDGNFNNPPRTIVFDVAGTISPGDGPGTYTIITYMGTLSGSLTLGSLPSGYSAVLDAGTPGQVRWVVE